MLPENTDCGILQSVILPLENTDPRIIGSVISPCKKVNTGNKTEIDCIISGTYYHPDLIPHIACWISPNFALLVSKIVNGYITQEYKAHLAAAKQELDAKQLALEQATELLEAATLDAHHAQEQMKLKEHQQEDAARA